MGGNENETPIDCAADTGGRNRRLLGRHYAKVGGHPFWSVFRRPGRRRPRPFLRFSVAFEQVGCLEYEPKEWRQVSGVGNTIHHLADRGSRIILRSTVSDAVRLAARRQPDGEPDANQFQQMFQVGPGLVLRSATASRLARVEVRCPPISRSHRHSRVFPTRRSPRINLPASTGGLFDLHSV